MNINRPMAWLARSAAFIAALALALATPAGALTRYTAVTGVDSPTCGASQTPCRSIGQTIANASAGDKIVVGPGRYGDVNGDGTFGNAPGEEIPHPNQFLIFVDKALTIVSRDGAGSTIIDGGAGLFNSYILVGLTANAVKFGGLNAGFTLTRGAAGIQVPLNGLGTVAKRLCEEIS
jgi:hypothetical protein